MKYPQGKVKISKPEFATFCFSFVKLIQAHLNKPLEIKKVFPQKETRLQERVSK